MQFDSIQTRDLNVRRYEQVKNEYSDILVLGGVGFKYIQKTGNPLEQDLHEAMPRCDAIVTTGAGTGIETPIEKLKEYKRLLEDFPLVVGAGVNLENINEQLRIADAAIIGSYFKPDGNTYQQVDRKRVRSLMDIVNDLREKLI